ncbi:MAG: hypothetical protein J4400_04125 [Candidatus Aenigmarchaeota archaeon]|nr:hypothetical protein [Candidatus Aenigmarchaeota archaeon]
MTIALVIEMSYEEAAMKALIDGVKDGRRDSLSEAGYVRDTLGFRPDTDTLRSMPIEVGPLPPPSMGVTHITPEGKAAGMRISSYIVELGTQLAKKYSKSKDWALSFIRRYARDVTNHEDYHVMSASLARGLEITEPVRDAMESVTTRGRYKVKKRAGKHKDAEFVKTTNPYPRAWHLAEAADWAPYQGPSGEGYAAFLGDASKEPMHKPLGRLAWQSAKAGFRKLGDYLKGSGVPSYAMARLN